MIEEKLNAYIEELRKEHSTYSIKAEYGDKSAKAKVVTLEKVINRLEQIKEVR